MDILTAVQSKGVQLKKVSSTNGGEWAGPCPSCGGDDRFRVWPNKKGGGGYWCRGCDKGGDLIEFYRWIDGMSYGDACRAAGMDPKKYEYSQPRLPSHGSDRESYSAHGHADPDARWREQAIKFVDQCHQVLVENTPMLDKLMDERGINIETVKRFRLGVNTEHFYRHRQSWALPDELRKDGKPKKLWIPRGLVIPYMVDGAVQRIRIRRPKADGDPRYYYVPGSSAAIMRIGDRSQAYVVVESELDALLIAQEAGDLVGLVAMGTSSSKPDTGTLPHLRAAEVILVALDADEAGERGSSWWLEHFHQAERWPVPQGKDPGDIHRTVDVRAWVLAGLPDAWRIGPSALQCVEVGGAPVEPVVEVAPVVVDAVRELGDLLKKTGARILFTPKRTAIDWRAGKSNNPDWRRISDLVFFDPDCWEYLRQHPHQVITAENFFMEVNNAEDKH